MESVYTLAQDQYGNYVTQVCFYPLFSFLHSYVRLFIYDVIYGCGIQHVLKRGKPEERSQIVQKLAGHVVQLSQHKFASNVIEKCLEYGDSTARGVLIEEIVGLGDNSENLLVSFLFLFFFFLLEYLIIKPN